jgi:membrane fusion protein
MRAAVRRLDGEVIVAPSITGAIITALSLAMLLVALLAAALLPINTRQAARGWTSIAGGQIMVTAQVEGVVEEVFVEDQQTVSANAPLARVVPAGDPRGANLASSLSEERRAAEGRVITLGRELADTRSTLVRQLRDIEGELGRLADRVAIQKERTDLARQALSRSETLAAQGYLPARELEARRAALIDARDAEVQIAIEEGRARKARDDLKDQLDAIPTALTKLNLTGEIEAANVDQRQIEAERLASQIYRAPVAGSIATLATRRGQSVRAGETLAVLMPSGTEIEVDLQIPASAIGRIRQGQAIDLRFDAYPYQQFGSQKARLVSISSGVLPPSASTIPGVTPAGPFYRARAKLTGPAGQARGVGLLLTAEIITDDRTLLARFMGALRSAGRSVT